LPEQHKGLDYEAMQQMALQQQGDIHLLVIGVDAYTHCPPLSNCVKDAKDFTALMQQQYQVSPERTYELYDGQATRTKVLRQLKNLRHKVQEDDSLIVYFSGHGEIEDEEGYWIPVEGKPGEDEGWIAASSIKRRLNQVESFHTLVIADACFAGSFFVTYKSATRQLLHSRRSRLGISGSHSRERAFDGQAGDNSPFAKELLRALRHNQQPLPVDQLFTQVRDAVAAATQGRQTPIFKNIDVKGDDQGQFVFVPAITEGQAWAACQKTGTVAAYEAFLAQFPDGRHHSEAKETLHFLKEENAWHTARQGNSIAAYLRYRDTYPQGRYFAQSVQAIADLEDAQDWATAQGRDTIAAYLQYQTRHPRGQYRAQAQQAVQRLRQEMTTPTPKPEVKPKTSQPQVESKPPPPKPPREEKYEKASASVSAPEKEEGYSRYRMLALLGLLLVIFLIIGFSRGWFTGSGGREEPLSQDSLVQIDEQLNEDTPQLSPATKSNPNTQPIEPAIDLTDSQKPEQEKPDRAPYQQPQIERSFRGDILTVSIQQGKRPYDLKLTRRGATVYQQKLNTSGDHRITITDYREDPGTYTIEVEDATGKEVERNVRIDAPKVSTSTSSGKTGTATLGGQSYRTVRLNGLTWMAENLNYDVGDGSWCYDNDASNCREHGRLYNWEAAKKACRAVGWRLPSDQEWREMAKQFGGANDDASDGGKAAYKALIEGGKSGFAAQLGGYRSSNGVFIVLGAWGCYWSATQRDADRAWYYLFYRDVGRLSRVYYNKSVGRSCRCVQD
jgi:uncharacterized protein (TIGR02145 family)